jgi:hypothetical protein
MPSHPLEGLRRRLLLDHIHQAVEAAADHQRYIDEMVSQARAEGASWKQIGEALGVTYQSAWERYGKGIEAHPPASAEE